MKSCSPAQMLSGTATGCQRNRHGQREFALRVHRLPIALLVEDEVYGWQMPNI
jgi:hypothetical protein